MSDNKPGLSITIPQAAYDALEAEPELPAVVYIPPTMANVQQVLGALKPEMRAHYFPLLMGELVKLREP